MGFLQFLNVYIFLRVLRSLECKLHICSACYSAPQKYVCLRCGSLQAMGTMRGCNLLIVNWQVPSWTVDCGPALDLFWSLSLVLPLCGDLSRLCHHFSCLLCSRPSSTPVSLSEAGINKRLSRCVCQVQPSLSA